MPCVLDYSWWWAANECVGSAGYTSIGKVSCNDCRVGSIWVKAKRVNLNAVKDFGDKEISQQCKQSNKGKTEKKHKIQKHRNRVYTIKWDESINKQLGTQKGLTMLHRVPGHERGLNVRNTESILRELEVVKIPERWLANALFICTYNK